MSDITIISKITNPTGYYSVAGEWDQAEITGTLFDAMIEAQERMGQVNWHSLTPTMARGTAYNHQHGGSDRVAVIDTENADGREVIDVMNWLRDA